MLILVPFAIVIIAPFAIGYGIVIILWNFYDVIHERFFPEKKQKKEEMKMTSFEKIYYGIFPKELEKKKQTIKEQERKEKAELLLEFEDLAKKKEEMKKYFENQTKLLKEMIKVVDDATSANPFMYGYDMRFALYTLASFDPSKLDSYQTLKEKAIEYERITFRMFAINQKLKLLGLDYRARGPYA